MVSTHFGDREEQVMIERRRGKYSEVYAAATLSFLHALVFYDGDIGVTCTFLSLCVSS